MMSVGRESEPRICSKVLLEDVELLINKDIAQHGCTTNVHPILGNDYEIADDCLSQNITCG
jgi:hypothetical protein